MVEKKKETGVGVNQIISIVTEKIIVIRFPCNAGERLLGLLVFLGDLTTVTQLVRGYKKDPQDKPKDHVGRFLEHVALLNN